MRRVHGSGRGSGGCARPTGGSNRGCRKHNGQGCEDKTAKLAHNDFFERTSLIPEGSVKKNRSGKQIRSLVTADHSGRRRSEEQFLAQRRRTAKADDLCNFCIIQNSAVGPDRPPSPRLRAGRPGRPFVPLTIGAPGSRALPLNRVCSRGGPLGRTFVSIGDPNGACSTVFRGDIRDNQFFIDHSTGTIPSETQPVTVVPFIR